MSLNGKAAWSKSLSDQSKEVLRELARIGKCGVSSLGLEHCPMFLSSSALAASSSSNLSALAKSLAQTKKLESENYANLISKLKW